MGSPGHSKKLISFLALGVVVLLMMTGLSFSYGFDGNENDSLEFKEGPAEKRGEEQTITEKEVVDYPDEKIEELGIFIEYDESYRTRNYEVWEEVELEDRDYNLTAALDSVVARQDTSLEISAPNGTEIDIIPSRDEMTPLDIQEDEEIILEIPEEGTIGRYTIEADWDEGEDTIELFVIYELPDGLSDDEIKAYAYDEEGDRDEKGYFLPLGAQYLEEADLWPYGEKSSERPAMYEFALEAVSGTTKRDDSAVRLSRIVSQRSEAVPSPLEEHQPMIRDASEMLFGDGTSLYHGEEIEYQGLDLDDARILSENDKTLESIEDPIGAERSKLINAWCDETSVGLTALLRSIGIPSRIVTVRPGQEFIEDSELMGHFSVEVWFESSMYDFNEEDGDGDWYVIDADEWNMEWYVADPPYWSFIGETFSSRENYGEIVELYFRDNPYYNYGIEHFIVFDKDREAKFVTDYYRRGQHNLGYGEVEKYLGRGGGDLYYLELEETSTLTLQSSGGIDADLHVNGSDYPALSITYQGYPPPIPDRGLVGDEIVLEEGTYHIGIYAPDVGDPEGGDQHLEGNYGKYTLTLEETPQATPASTPSEIDEVDIDQDYDEIELNWTDPENNGSPILYYNIYRDGELITRTTSTSYVDRDVISQETYSYKIIAINALGECGTEEEYQVTAARSIYRDRPKTAVASISLIALWIVSYLLMKKYKQN